MGWKCHKCGLKYEYKEEAENCCYSGTSAEVDVATKLLDDYRLHDIDEYFNYCLIHRDTCERFLNFLEEFCPSAFPSKEMDLKKAIKLHKKEGVE